MSRATTSFGLAIGACLLLAGCASTSGSDAATSSDSPAAAGSDCPVSASDVWVKAAESGMTAAFGTLANSSDAEVVVIGARSQSAGRVEIHEVVDVDGQMVMQPKEAGLAIPAGETVTLAPGADHLMLMELPTPINAGDDVTITLECQGGTTATIGGQAKTFTGAQEQYQSSASASPSAMGTQMDPTPASPSSSQE